MAGQRYYLYYEPIGSGGTVGKPSGYSSFMHNPDAKRMSFLLPSQNTKAQEQIGKFIQEFQRLNAGKFKIKNAVTSSVSNPPPPVPKPAPTKPAVGGTDPKPPTSTTTTGGTTTGQEKEKEDNTLMYVGIAILIVVVLKISGKKKRK
ncbi:hypothetical protein [Leptospira kmetyi]|uniref:hypothetical protein n=1 Tax=Leptospira kmetyi TaxID=408139 RepID=UPI003EBFFE04